MVVYSEKATFIIDGNYLYELDIANIYKTNKTTCLSSYAHGNSFIKVTNKADYQAGLQEDTICNDVNLSNVSFDQQPLTLISKDNFTIHNLWVEKAAWF